MGLTILVLVLSMSPVKKLDLAEFQSLSECETFLKQKASEDTKGYTQLMCVQIERLKQT